jgi:hypothetical protein
MMVEKFFLYPASTPAVECDTSSIQLSLADVSGLSTFIPDQYRPNTTSLTVEKTHENPILPLEDDDLEDVVNSVLPTPDWSSGFGFSTS